MILADTGGALLLPFVLSYRSVIKSVMILYIGREVVRCLVVFMFDLSLSPFNTFDIQCRSSLTSQSLLVFVFVVSPRCEKQFKLKGGKSLDGIYF